MTKTILIAEDDKTYQNIYQSKLTADGYVVLLANNGEELLKLIESTTPDLILLDIIMPKLDGIETLKKIKSNLKLTNIPVIVLSSLGQEEDVKIIKNLGAKEYIIKGTISIDELLTKIKNYLL